MASKTEIYAKITAIEEKCREQRALLAELKARKTAQTEKPAFFRKIGAIEDKLRERENLLAKLRAAVGASDDYAGLSAAPGDVNGFVDETSETAAALIEHVFLRAGDERNDNPLRVDGKPLSARVEGVGTVHVLRDYDSEQTEQGWIVTKSGPIPYRAALAYAWIARQFVRGVTGMPVLSHSGAFRSGAGVEEGSYLRDDQVEARLGLNVWRIGRNVATEVEDWNDRVRSRLTPTTRDLRVRVIEAVRLRLNWPALPDDYDPPPPSQWPAEDDPTLETIRRVIADVFFSDSRHGVPTWLSGRGNQAVVSVAEDDARGAWFRNAHNRSRIIAVIYREYGLPDPYNGNAIKEWDGVVGQLSESIADGGLGFAVGWESYNAGVMYLYRARV